MYRDMQLNMQLSMQQDNNKESRKKFIVQKTQMN